ncbi:hypothetical protein WA026_016749 [Henosepilachna vigintioctopunctata]|uniref:Uncharacterized protein n=1 Tax=Henosepilachna vigintioctopunctata TaxID=420089 RepID=A0AAW1USE6_9CUCU
MEKLQLTFQVLASADGKSNILCVTRITTTDGRIFKIPKEHMNASHHKELTKTPAYTKVKNACSQRGHLRRVWINLTSDLRNTYCDEDDNIQFNEEYLEEIDEKDGDATANASEQSLVKLLERILEKSQRETEQNSGKLANEFAIDKFDGRNVNAEQWWDKIDRENIRKTEDLHNEVSKLEHLVYKKHPQVRKSKSNVKEGTEKRQCKICKDRGKGTRFHPESECWFRDQEKKGYNWKQVNNLILDVELSPDDPKN